MRNARIERIPVATPAGVFQAEFRNGKLGALHFPGGVAAAVPGRSHSADRRLARELKQYFTGKRSSFSLPLDLNSGTDFQRKVWRALRRIPYGQTKTYGEVARAIGSPKTSRAVGAACGQNPIPIIVPCHRVVAHNQKLGGFSGGLHWKKRLLALERAWIVHHRNVSP